MSNVKKNFIYNSIYQIFAIIVPLITTPYLSRVLGAGGVGDYAFAYSIANYFSLFVMLGLKNYGNRTIAIERRNDEILAKTFWNIYTMQVCSGIIVSIVYFVFNILWKESSPLNIIMYGLIAASVFDITWFFYGIEEFRTTTIRDMFIKLMTVVCIFVFVRDADDVLIYAAIRAFGLLFSQLLLWPLLIKKINFVKPQLKDVIIHIKPNLILFIPWVAVSLYTTMDKIMLGVMSNHIEVGYYESCEKVIQVPLAAIMALGTVMMPHMSHIYSSSDVNQDKATGIIRKSEHLMIILASVIGFGIMAVAKEFVPLYYGHGFDKCIYIFYIIMPSCLFLAFANVIRTQYLMPNKMDKQFIVSLFIGALTNLFINSLLIPRFQSIGAAVGTLFAEAAVCIVQILYVRKLIPIVSIFKECIIYVIISIVMFFIGLFVRIELGNSLIVLILKIFLCGVFWLFSMWIVLIRMKRINYFK